VVRTDEATGLHVIPAGDFAANSSRLFYSKEMVSLLESLRLQYDLVVLDAPPLFAVSDAPLLAAIADAVLLCVKWRGTSRKLAEHAVRSLREAGANPVGVVLTQVDLRAYRATGYSDSPVHDRRNNGYYYG
jgi:Mrp family chromosome partitioning ATPase